MTCSYYNTGNYATIEDTRTTDDKQKQRTNYKDRYNSSAVFLCGAAEDVVGKKPPGNPGCGK